MELKGVLMLSDSFFPVNGGREVVIDNLMKCFDGKLNALLGVPVFKKHLPFDDSSLSYRVIRCKSISYTKNEVLAKPDRKFKKYIQKEIQEGKIQVIHIQTKYGLMKYALKLRRKYALPVVTTVHTNYPEVYKKNVRIPLLSKILLKRVVKILNKVDLVTTVSEYMKTRLVSMGVKTKIEVVTNGNKFAKSTVDSGNINIFNKKYNLNNNKNILLFVGRLSPEKSIDVIIEALSYVQNAFKMVFIGGGDINLYSCLAKKYNVAEKCQFLGQINNLKEQATLFAGADFQIFPSATETFGMTISECGVLGTPSIVMRGMATAEHIEDGFNGFIFDGSAKDLAKKIDEVLSDKEKLNVVSENAKKTFNLTWDEVADKYVEIYNNLIN